MQEDTTNALCSRCGRERTPGGLFCPHCGAAVGSEAATVEVPTPALRTGALLGGKFKLGPPLGRGGFGTVFQARDTKLERDVAIKTIRQEAFGSSSDRDAFERRFQREARAVARLAHPNIVTLHESGEEDGVSYLVMELVRGKTLRALLEERGALPAAEALPILRGLLHALGHAHASGVIHRDVKPENIMIREDGLLKVADFGVAKAVFGPTPTITEAGSVLGTPSYMAPEQIRGKTVDARADLFSAAAVAYELVVGRKPFEADSVPSLIFKILNDDPPPPEVANPAIPRSFGQAIMRSLRKEPDERFASCGDFLQALEQPAGAAAPASGVATRPLARSREDAETRAVGSPPAAAATAGDARRRGPSALLLLLPVAVLGLYLISRKQQAPAPAPADTSKDSTIEELKRQVDEQGRALLQMKGEKPVEAAPVPSAKASERDAEREQQVRATLRSLGAAFEALDARAASALFEDDATFGDGLRGREVIRGFLEHDFQNVAGAATEQRRRFLLGEGSLEVQEDVARARVSWEVEPFEAATRGAYDLFLAKHGTQWLVRSMGRVGSAGAGAEAEIQETLRSVVRAFEERDADRLVDALAVEAVLSRDGKTMRGLPEIRRIYARLFEQPIFASSFRSTSIQDVRLDWATTTASARIVRTFAEGEWVVTLRLAGHPSRGWEVVELSEEAVPAAAAAPAASPGSRALATPALPVPEPARVGPTESVLSLTTAPPGAYVKIDGQLKGVTPLEAIVPRSKPFSLHLERAGHRPHHVASMRVTSEREALDVKLTPK